MKRFLLGVLSGAAIALVGVGTWSAVADHLKPRLVHEVCDPGPEQAPDQAADQAAGPLCVQLRDDGSPGGVLWVARKDPELGPRISYVASPFTDLEHHTAEEIEVTFETDHLVVHGHDGSELILTDDFISEN
ncbi:hypothetical protein [Promicromonospora sp. NPDC050249]|uniref:hypothetical protein n=1 Tax=Promicromonospora sp. NPDC050249 TaxID=3154743 RepID=UPI00340C873C